MLSRGGPGYGEPMALWCFALAVAGLVVDADEARARVDAGATVLDARGTLDYLAGHIPGAVRVDWRIGVDGGPLSGQLGDPVTVGARYAALGVDDRRPVLVVGDWTARWGEEARVAWDLVYLGHPSVAVLEGGMATWTGPLERGPVTPVAGRLTVRVRPEVRATRATVSAGGHRLIDVREPDEYAGATRHGEAVGGHIPGAVNVPWRQVDRAALPDGPLIVYCTGGVRSAFAWMRLTDAGRVVANYDGSWWEWARAVKAGEVQAEANR